MLRILLQNPVTSRLAGRLACAAFTVGLTAATASASTIAYTSSSDFEAALGVMVLDDYSAAGYESGDLLDDPGFDVHSDASMSSVLGETRYRTTGTTFDNNIVEGQQYCNGCNGSFELDFRATSVGTAKGVFGVGFDFSDTDYLAFVTFGDGTTANYALTGINFLGITSTRRIASVHIGLQDGGATDQGQIRLDNLRVGAVPEPASTLLLGAGLAALGLRRRRA